jgi:hypothetical protein
MNTAWLSYSDFFGVSPSRSGLRIRNDEVVGSIPTGSTISQQLTRADFAIMFHNVPIPQNLLPSIYRPAILSRLWSGFLA